MNDTPAVKTTKVYEDFTLALEGNDVTVQAAPEAESKEEKKSEDLSEKTVTELRAMAKEAGVKGFSTMKKDELIEVLNK